MNERNKMRGKKTFQSLATVDGLGAMRHGFSGMGALHGSGLTLQQAAVLANPAAFAGLPAT
jgi:hypothetical protein